MKLCIFEDEGYRRLLPLTWTRPVFFLRCGMTSLAEKIEAAFPELDTVYHCRNYLAETAAEVSGKPVNVFDEDDYLFVNGRVLFGKENYIPRDRTDRIYTAAGVGIAAVVSRRKSGVLRKIAGAPVNLRRMFPDFQVVETGTAVVDYPWDLVTANPGAITGDFLRLCPEPARRGTVHDGVHLLNPDRVDIKEDAVIMPGVVLDAGKGPVVCDSGSTIMANAVVKGPAYLGKNAQVKMGARIYGGTSIGEYSKVGGEVVSSVIFSHSNKQHEGFLGHSYVGQWVNLGAGTTNSNLKNNYKPVKMTIDGTTVETGLQFAGLIIGDHSKTGIGTLFNTGSVVGVHCNLFGGGVPPKYVPSFSWVEGGALQEYRLEKALETAQHVVYRKKMELSVAFRSLYTYIFRKTKGERAGFPL